jgi:hypothetical protein
VKRGVCDNGLNYSEMTGSNVEASRLSTISVYSCGSLSHGELDGFRFANARINGGPFCLERLTDIEYTSISDLQAVPTCAVYGMDFTILSLML